MTLFKAAVWTISFAVAQACLSSAHATEKVTFGYFPVADFLVTAIRKFDRPTVPIAVRDSELAAPLGAVAVEKLTCTL